MPADPAFIALLSVSMFCGALVNAFAGFAFSPVAAIFLVGVLPPSTLIPLLMISSVLVQIVSIVRLRGEILTGRSDAMLLGGAFGVPIAVMLLPVVNGRGFQIGFGIFLACYALVMLRRPASRAAKPRAMKQEAAVGFLGGLVGGLTAMPGALPVLYCDLKGLSKTGQRVIVQPFILIMQVLAILMLGSAHQLTAEVARLVELSLPALVLGVGCGLALFGRVPDARFRHAVLALLLLTGIGTAAGKDLLAAISGVHFRPASATAPTP